MSSRLGQESPREGLDPEWLPGTSQPRSGVFAGNESSAGIANLPTPAWGSRARNLGNSSVALLAQDALGPSPVQEAEVGKAKGL